MLKLAIDHVNRLRPRFLLISGDFTNAWPCEENARVVAAQVATLATLRRVATCTCTVHAHAHMHMGMPLLRWPPSKRGPHPNPAQVASFQEALRELDPSIPLILQPGNHDVGQNPSAGAAAAYPAAALPCYGPTYYGSTYYGSTYYGSTYYGPAYYGSTYYGSTYYGPTYYGPTYYGSTYYGSTYYGFTYYAGSTYLLWLLLGTALVSEYCARFGDDYFSFWVGGVKYAVRVRVRVRVRVS
jgi:3',5'-cyclic AMP phosphodiesterase CpdA